MKAIDELKDQSFFLSQVDPVLFNKILFPVGDFYKHQIKTMATEIGLEKISKKRSSAGICFVGKRKFTKFIGNYLPKQCGKILDLETGQLLGNHDGIFHYTIGQRVPVQNQQFNKTKQTYFVAKKSPNENIIFAVIFFISF